MGKNHLQQIGQYIMQGRLIRCYYVNWPCAKEIITLQLDSPLYLNFVCCSYFKLSLNPLCVSDSSFSPRSQKLFQKYLKRSDWLDCDFVQWVKQKQTNKRHCLSLGMKGPFLPLWADMSVLNLLWAVGGHLEELRI